MTTVSACTARLQSTQLSVDLGKYFFNRIVVDRSEFFRLRRMRLTLAAKKLNEHRRNFLTHLRSEQSPLFRQRRSTLKALFHWFHHGTDTHEPSWKLQYAPLYGSPGLRAAALLGDLAETLEEAEKTWETNSNTDSTSNLISWNEHGGLLQ